MIRRCRRCGWKQDILARTIAGYYRRSTEKDKYVLETNPSDLCIDCLEALETEKASQIPPEDLPLYISRLWHTSVGRGIHKKRLMGGTPYVMVDHSTRHIRS